jgi:redox-sensitive bicupin YhaK (pirin superfamily)
VHVLQIWILPDAESLPPRYDQKRFAPETTRGRLRLLASADGSDGSIAIRQDARLYASRLEAGESVALTVPPDRHLWVQVLRGEVDVNGQALSAGDGLAASQETDFRFTGGAAPSELLAFDLK